MFTTDGKLQLREYKNLIRDYGDAEMVFELTSHVHEQLVNENAFGYGGSDPWDQSRISERAREIKFELEKNNE